MFNAFDFTFAGQSASMFGLFLCDIGSRSHGDNPFANKANIIETRLPQRITPLHYGVRYHEEPLQFSLIFGSEQELDRYQMQEVANWLTGYQDYQWLTIDQYDMEDLQFRCLIQELTPISVGWLPVAFEASVICDCPYAYGRQDGIGFGGFTYQPAVTGFRPSMVLPIEDSRTVANNSTVRTHIWPEIKVVLESGATEFTIENRTTGKEMRFENLPAGGITVQIDNENRIVRDGNNEYNLYDYFNFVFLDLAPGENEIRWYGAGWVEIKWRTLHNVGA